MRRREVITLVGGAAAVWPVAGWPQQKERLRRLAFFRVASENDPVEQAYLKAFRDAMRKLGWIEGRNLRIDVQYVGGVDLQRRRAVAAELVGLAPDVIFASPHPAIEAIYERTRTIPIVGTGSGDFVAAGFAQSHARPGGNVTGFMTFEATINTKYLQLLKDMAPNVRRVGVMQTEGSTWRGDFAAIEAVAEKFAARPIPMLVRDPVDIERAIEDFASEANGGLILPPDTGTGRHRALIVALAAKHRLPAIYANRQSVAIGGLMSYAADPADSYRQAAGYVDRILRGDKPADLPLQAPTNFELVINTKAAAALGIEVPLPLLIRADELIE